MHILIVTATAAELAPVGGIAAADGRVPPITAIRHARHDVDLLTTGVGMVATAAWTAKTLAERHYDFAINCGVCGSFDRALPPPTVVNIVDDRIAGLGAEDGDAFLTLSELNLPGDSEFTSSRPDQYEPFASLPRVRAITVNTAHGNDASIAAVVNRYRPQVESMEGAGFMQACAIAQVRHAQVRAVSNMVERRNRAAWRLSEAIEALGRTMREFLDSI